MPTELKPALQTALANLQTGDFSKNATALFQLLGYRSDKTAPLAPKSADELLERYDLESKFRRKEARVGDWKSADILFQLTDAEVKDAISAQTGLFQSSGDAYNGKIIQSYLFLAVELEGEIWNRGDLATIVREINKLFPMPALVLFRHGGLASLGVINRRLNKTNAERDVLEKVTLVKDIRLENPHRAHLEILGDLALSKLRERFAIANFVDLDAAWRKQLDAQTLNAAFYRDYKTVFGFVEQNAILPADLELSRRDWTQRFFNRLIFLRFLEKKGWMHFGGDDNYLRALWNASQKSGDDFLNDRLYFVFFWGLGLPNDVSIERMAELEKVRGVVPFLNGGLFESFGRGDERGAVSFQNQSEVFESVLELFERYYFTVAENTPLEEEVGVDPEMLGKVFEELVTGRHESGSYYTPRGIVSFMGREAIKGYLGGGAAIEKFVDENDASDLRDPESILRALREITICDPACGSGAYLLGMMSELLRLRETLFAAHAKDHAKIFERKLEIIARNLYGVDKDSFATQIAMLRLWLSLVVEFEGATPPPLPNLKYKIEVGDSLGAPLAGLQATLDSQTVAEFNHKKREYVAAHGEEKQQLEGEIENLRRELKAWSDVPQGEQIHDWRIEFAEIFSPAEAATTVFGTLNMGVQLPTIPNGGFDIVVANPPYLSTKHGFGRDNKKNLAKIYRTAKGQFDAYMLFLERAFSLLKEGGSYAYIIPQPVLTNSNMAPLREVLAEKTVSAIADPGCVFKAHVEPIVLIGRNQPCNSEDKVRVFHEEAFLENHFVPCFIKPLSEIATSSGAWNINATAQNFAHLKNSPRLGDLFLIARGIECGKKDECLTDHNGKNHFPLLRGEDVEPFCLHFENIYVERGSDASKFKPIEIYQAPKLILRRVTNRPIAAVDREGFHVLNTLYVAQPKAEISLEYVCALLNSQAMSRYFAQTFVNTDKLFPYIRKEQLESLPIPQVSDDEQQEIESLVREMNCENANPEDTKIRLESHFAQILEGVNQ